MPWDVDEMDRVARALGCGPDRKKSMSCLFNWVVPHRFQKAWIEVNAGMRSNQ